MKKLCKSQLADYKVITISHKTANIDQLKDYLVDVNESGAFPSQRLGAIKEHLGIGELMYLNTCNRIMFLFTYQQKIDYLFLNQFFNLLNSSLHSNLLQTHLEISEVHEGAEAIEHLFSVGASLHSAIIGEREILGQIKKAYSNSVKHQLSGDSIRLAIEQTVLFTKKIYNETNIGTKPVSIVSIAFRQLMEMVPNRDAGILIIGAGQTNQNFGHLLHKYGYQNVHVFNRTFSKAKKLAKKTNGTAYHLHDLVDFDKDFCTVISCTGASGLILSETIFEYIKPNSRDHFFMIDLAVPRDIDPSIVSKYNVNYVDVEKLKSISNTNIRYRKEEIRHAEGILADYIVAFNQVFKQRQLELALIEIPNQVKALKRSVFETVFENEINSLDENSIAILKEVMDYFEKKYISIPMQIAKANIMGLDAA